MVSSKCRAACARLTSSSGNPIWIASWTQLAAFSRGASARFPPPPHPGPHRGPTLPNGETLAAACDQQRGLTATVPPVDAEGLCGGVKRLEGVSASRNDCR